MRNDIIVIAPKLDEFEKQFDTILSDGEIYTFWSLEELYPNNRFRYHLGHFSMIEKINFLLNHGKIVHAIICDSDHITMNGEHYNNWQRTIDTWSAFIRINIDGAIRIEKLSTLIQVKKSQDQSAARKLGLQIDSVLSEFRDMILERGLSGNERSLLRKYREYVHEDSVEKSLTELLKHLQRRFPFDHRLLLSAAYTFFFRPSWFSSSWLRDIILFLSDNSDKDRKIILEANRNAYAWLSLKSFFEITRSNIFRNKDEFNYHWPKIGLLQSLLSTDGKKYMGIQDPNSCLLIDSQPIKLKEQILSLSTETRKSINSHFFNGQISVNLKSAKWNLMLLKSLQQYQATNLSLLKNGNHDDEALPTYNDKINIDIAIVTILPEEYDAVLKLLKKTNIHNPTNGRANLHSWVKGELYNKNFKKKFHIVLAKAGKPGLVSASLATSNTIAEFNPRYILVIGIAGGFPKEKLKKGDVVIATHIWNYEYGKIEHGFKPRIHFTHQTDQALLNSATTIIKDKNWTNNCESSPPNRNHMPKAITGIIGSGNKIIDDIDDPFVQQLILKVPELQAVEMEGAGVAEAIENHRTMGHQIGYIMIRGISDMTSDARDTKKNISKKQREKLKKYASEIAANFGIYMIRNTWPTAPNIER